MELGMVMDLCNCSNIVRDTHNITILFLVPYILPLILLPGLLRIVGGFKIALGLLGLWELNSLAAWVTWVVGHILVLWLASRLSSYSIGIWGLNFVSEDCTKVVWNLCCAILFTIYVDRMCLFISMGCACKVSLFWPECIGVLSWNVVGITGLLGILSIAIPFLVPYIPPPILLPGLHILYEDCRIVLRL